MLSTTQKQDLLKRLKCGHLTSIVNDVKVCMLKNRIFVVAVMVVLMCPMVYTRSSYYMRLPKLF
jgi:hypothetical protein